MDWNIIHPRHMKKHVQYARARFAQRKRRKKVLHTLLIVIAIIFIRRGTRGLLDAYLLPNSPMLSMLVSIGLGFIILYLDNKKIEKLAE